MAVSMAGTGSWLDATSLRWMVLDLGGHLVEFLV